jgi:hypothetical protein
MALPVSLRRSAALSSIDDSFTYANTQEVQEHNFK